MKNTKFVVNVSRSGSRSPEHVLRIDRTPHQDNNQSHAGTGYGNIHGQIHPKFPVQPEVKVRYRLAASPISRPHQIQRNARNPSG